MSERSDADDPIVYEPTAELRPETEPPVDEGAATQIDAPTDDPLEPPPGEEASFWDRRRGTDTRSKVRQRIEQRRSSEIRGGKRGVPPWAWAAAGLAVLLVILTVALSGDDDGLTAQDALDTDKAAGVLDVAGTNLLSLGAGRVKGSGGSAEELREFEGKVVTAQGASVQSVVSEEGFWIGTKARRFFVSTVLVSEPGPEIRVGDKVSFAAVLRPVPLDFRARFGLEKDDVRRLRGTALYLEATMAPSVD